MNEKAHHPRRDRLKQLRAFCYSARLRSISQAAERISSSQPAVSQQVSALEEQFAVPLFRRSGPHLALTPEGRRLYALANPLVEGVDRLPDTFAERYHGTASGNLDIAAGPSGGAFMLPGYLRQLREQHPGAQVNMRIADGVQRLRWLRAYEVDIIFAAVHPPTIPPDLEFRQMLSSDMVLITPEDHPLAGRTSVDIDEFASCPWITHPVGQSVTESVDMIMRRHGHVANHKLEVSGWGAIKFCVEAGIGISIVPDICVTERDRVWKIPVRKYFPARVYGMATRRDDMLPLLARELIRLIDPDMPDESAEQPPEHGS